MLSLLYTRTYSVHLQDILSVFYMDAKLLDLKKDILHLSHAGIRILRLDVANLALGKDRWRAVFRAIAQAHR